MYYPRRAFYKAWLIVVVAAVMPPSLVAATPLFWTQSDGVWKGDTSGAAPEKLAGGFDPRDLIVTSQELVFADDEPRVPPAPTGVIVAYDRTGGQRQVWQNALPSPSGLAIDAVRHWIYWSDIELHTITRAPLDNLAERKVVLPPTPSIQSIHDIALNPADGSLFFTFVNPLIDGLFPGGVGRIDPEQGTMTQILSGLSEPQGLAIDEGLVSLYWTDNLLGRSGIVRQANLDGTNVVDLFTDLSQPEGLALDPATHALLWVDAAAGELWQGDLTNRSVERLYSDLPSPRFVTLTVVPEPSVFHRAMAIGVFSPLLLRRRGGQLI